MRKSTRFLIYLSLNVILLSLLFSHAFLEGAKGTDLLEKKRQMVRDYRLTDLCLFTEASYTRHLSVSDLHAPFQDGPMSLEHFPSGSIFSAPAARRR